MIKIAICDEDKTITGQLEEVVFELCNKKGIKAEIDIYESKKYLKKEILSGTIYDLLYLDIEPNNDKDLEIARDIRKKDKNVLYIFMSSCDNYSIELFRLDVFAFIKKPVNMKEFIEIFFAAYNEICSKNFYFYFQFKEKEYKLPCKEILYFESDGRKINIYMRNESIYVFNGKLSKVDAKLHKGKIPFLRIHQSYLVNFHLIISRSRSSLMLINGKELPISKNRKTDFAKRYYKLLEYEKSM